LYTCSRPTLKCLKGRSYSWKMRLSKYFADAINFTCKKEMKSISFAREYTVSKLISNYL